MLISKPYTFSVGAVIVAAEHNSNFDTIYNAFNGNINNVNIVSGAGITDDKLAQISTAGKVSTSALTGSLAGLAYAVPQGGIIMWSGTIATIPTGWYLCDGSNSTPDLRNRFVVCADADSGGAAKSTITGVAAQSGGSVTISVSNLPAHSHTIPSGTSLAVTAGAGVTQNSSTADTTTVSTSNAGSGTAYTQPFYALAFIMRS